MTTPTTDATATPPEPAKSNRAALFMVFIVVFIDLLGFGIVLPLLPRYADDLLPATGIDASLHGITIGLLLSSFSIMQFIFAPIWGRISDRVGRRPILLIGLLGSVVFYGLFGYALSMPLTAATTALILMFVARIGAGIAGATIATAQAVIADSTPKEKRAHGMALIGAAFGIGFTFGPLLGALATGPLKEYVGLPGYLAAGLSLIALLIGYRKLPETRRPDVPSTHRGWLNPVGLIQTLKTPTVGLLVLAFFLATFAFANFESTLSLLTKTALGFGTADNFLIFAYVGFVLMMTQGFIYRRMVKKIDEVTLMRIGVVTMLLGLAGLAVIAQGGETLPMQGTILLVSLAVAVFGFAFVTPSAQALISKRSDPNRQGEILGVNQSFSALARILGPITGLTLFNAGMNHILPFVLAVALLGIVLLTLPAIRRDPANH